MESNWGGVCHTGEMAIQYFANSLMLLPGCFHHTSHQCLLKVEIPYRYRFPKISDQHFYWHVFFLGGKHFQKNRFLNHDTTGPTHHQTWCLCVFFFFCVFLVIFGCQKKNKTPRTWEFLKFPSECFVKFIGRRWRLGVNGSWPFLVLGFGMASSTSLINLT